MGVTTNLTNKPLNPRGNDASPKGYNRAELYTGKALDFDGTNDNISIPLFNFTAGNKYSLCIYANRDNNGMIWSHSNQFVEIRFNSGALQLRTYDTAWNAYTLIDDVPANEWHQIVVTYDVDGNIWKSYLNGQFIKSLTAAASLYPRINRIGSTSAQYYDGEFANAKIFEVELTAAQVSDLYNNPEKIVPTGVADSALKLWLPMQEGAGTTAYDGSGNGNHGTISGATWTHGIGAPVAQTAVIDWNKGVNYLNEYSEDFSDSGWQKTGSQILAVSESNPFGKQTWEFGVVSLPTEVQIRGNVSGALNTSTAFKTIVIAKAGTLDWLRVRNLFMPDGGTNGNVWFNLSTGSVGTEQSSQTGTMTDLGDGWYKCEVSGTTGATIPNRLIDIGFTDTDATNEPSATGGTGFLVLSSISLNGIYVETLGVDQTSDVLLPQGLTTGRDITGVNLFENVRKQGALNLDGNSWAEVHDNASLDVSALTCEGWMYAESITTADNRIVSKWNSSYPERSYQLYGQNATINWMLSDGSSAYSITGGTLTQGQWHHLVGTYDGSTQKIYLNGVQVATTALSITLKQSSFKVMLGGYTAGLYSLNPIAQPRIYNRALTAEEVERNYNAGKNIYK